VWTRPEHSFSRKIGAGHDECGRDPSILFLARLELDKQLLKFEDELTIVGPTNDAFTALGDVAFEALRYPDSQKHRVEVSQHYIMLVTVLRLT
jgi:hypothetical protein